jgi:hypothetical protein
MTDIEPVKPPPTAPVPAPATPVPAAGAPRDARRRRIAWVIAIAADLLQFILLPLMVEGFLSPLNQAVDVGVAIVMTALLGWHWAFLPTFVAESLPFVDLVPTWTFAVHLATRKPRP